MTMDRIFILGIINIIENIWMDEINQGIYSKSTLDEIMIVSLT